MNQEIFKQITDELLNTYIQKNNDYGNSFDKVYDEFGIMSTAVRLMDKLERYKTLIKGTEQMVKDESIDDTVLDLCNYSIMTLIRRRKDKAVLEAQNNPTQQEVQNGTPTV